MPIVSQSLTFQPAAQNRGISAALSISQTWQKALTLPGTTPDGASKQPLNSG